MKKEMFPENGQWYKGNLHCHTTNSDGHLSPKQVAELYRQHGYHFLCLSEHDLYTDLRGSLDRADFITLPGVEASAWLLHAEDTGAVEALIAERNLAQLIEYRREGKIQLLKAHHIHGILGDQAMQQTAGERLIRHGEALLPPAFLDSWDGFTVAQNLSDSLRARGLFTAYNHPKWSRVEMGEIMGLRDFWAMEVYNYGTQVECGEGKGDVFWDALLQKGGRMHCFASDDNHNQAHLFDSLGGWICVRAESLTHEAIVRSLLAGEYYSSSGPEIYRFGIDGDTVFVECSNVERIHFFVGGGVGSSETVLRKGNALTGAEHRLRGWETYVRVECEDGSGRCAWTNPLWL